MDNFLDEILQESDFERNNKFLLTLNQYLPKYSFSILLKSTGEFLPPEQDGKLDDSFIAELWKKIDGSQPGVIENNTLNKTIWFKYIQELDSLLICDLLQSSKSTELSAIIDDVVGLCRELHSKDRLLAEKEALLLVHKKQRDGKIAVLEKRYQEILIKNQKQNAEYSSQLQSEISRQTSELRQANKDLSCEKEKAEKANIAKDQFLANMSHEIRTPMNGVVGMIEILLNTQLTEEQKQLTGLMKTSSEALLSVINDILDYSKIEAGKLDIETVSFDLRILLEEISDILSINAFQKGLHFAYIINSDVPTRLIGDPVRLRQIILNLCGNAIKFTSKGGVSIQANVLEETSSYVKLKFSVNDTGIGIPKDRLDILFHSFSQVDASMTRNYGGTGLGLAISKQLVEMMCGEIDVESVENEGSTFWFTLELQKQAAPHKEPVSQLKGVRVFFTGLHQTEKRMLIEQIKSFQGVFDKSDNRDEAYDKIIKAQQDGDPYRVIIVDQDLPGIDPIKFIQTLSPIIEKDTVYIIFAANGKDFVPHENNGNIIYLTKPVKYKELIDCIQQKPSGSNKRQGQNNKTNLSTGKSHIKTEPGQKKYKILLAEDDKVNQIVATNLIKKMKLGEVLIAQNGKKAVEMFDTGKFDLILMDGQMPVMSGLDATRQIRLIERNKNAQRTPIIALTAHAMSQDRKIFIDSGMDEYITKPINSKALNRAIKAVMGTALGDEPPQEIKTSEKIDTPVDLNELKEIMTGSKSLLKKCCQTFSSTYKPILDNILHCVETDDYKPLKKHAHRLKGSLKYVAAYRAVKMTEQLESMALNNDTDGADKIAHDLNQECDNVLQSLSDIMKQDLF